MDISNKDDSRLNESRSSSELLVQKIEDVAKRRGFFWQSSEIYGGLSGFYDYAHLGTMIKRKWENTWRKFFLNLDKDFYEIDSTTIMPEGVFKASGHIDSFVDPIAKCKKCGNAERADHLLEEHLKENFEGKSTKEMEDLIKKHRIKCHKCGGQIEEVSILNMMFPLSIGVGKVITAYPRPETAQGCYVNFKQEFETLRKRLPIGLAIIGRAYRNEISPRNSLIRMRELTQAELQIFFNPEKINEHEHFEDVKDYELLLFPSKNRDSNKIELFTCSDAVTKLGLPKFYVYHMAQIQKFYLEILKINKDKFRFKQLTDEEKAFYNKYHWDMELDLSLGWKEVGGCHYRTDHDLKGHENVSKKDMSVFLDGKKFIPHVLELSFGVDRNVYSLFDLSYYEDKERVIFKFPRHLTTYDCVILPLVNKDGMDVKAKEILCLLDGMNVFYDDSGSIGRRYRRSEEIGIPVAVTVDSDTLKDNTVTIRDRDSMKQIRVSIDELKEKLQSFLNGKELEDL